MVRFSIQHSTKYQVLTYLVAVVKGNAACLGFEVWGLGNRIYLRKETINIQPSFLEVKLLTSPDTTILVTHDNSTFRRKKSPHIT